MKIAKRHLALLVGLTLAVGVAVFAILDPRQPLPSSPASPITLSAPPGSKEEVLAPTMSFQPAGKEETYVPTPEEQQKMLSALQEEIQKKLNEDRQLQDLLRTSIQRRLEEEKTK